MMANFMIENLSDFLIANELEAQQGRWAVGQYIVHNQLNPSRATFPLQSVEAAARPTVVLSTGDSTGLTLSDTARIREDYGLQTANVLHGKRRQ